MKLIAKSALAILGMSLVVSACGGGKDDDGGSGGGDNGAAGSGSDGTGGTDDGSPEPDPDDKTSPTLVSTTPEDGATKVEAGITLTLTFSEAMDKSATASAISIVRTDGSDEAAPVEIAVKSVSWDKEGTVATVTVDAIEMHEVDTADALAYTYTVSISNVAADVSGNYLDDTKFSFSTLRLVTQVIEPSWRGYTRYNISGADYTSSPLGDAAVGCWGDKTAAGIFFLGHAHLMYPIGVDTIPDDITIISASLNFLFTVKANSNNTANTDISSSTTIANVWSAVGSVTATAVDIDGTPANSELWYSPPVETPPYVETFTSAAADSPVTGATFETFLRNKLETRTDERLEILLEAANADTTSKCTTKRFRFHANSSKLIVKYTH